MVDIVHHGIIGVGGALVAQQMGNVDLAVGFLIGSLLPDLDVIFMALGKSRYLRLHQSLTHSVFVVPFLSLGLGLLVAWALGASWLQVSVGCLLGALVHIMMDMLNSFGVRATWPHPRRYALDAFFFIDIYVLIASVIAVASLWLSIPYVWVVLLWAAFLAGYSSFRSWWRSKIVREAGVSTAIPSGIFPFFYYVTQVGLDGEVKVGHCKGLRREVAWESVAPAVSSKVMMALRTGPIFRDLEIALKLFRPVSMDVDSESGIITVVSKCVAVRNFENRYGETKSTLVDGRVVDEVAFL